MKVEIKLEPKEFRIVLKALFGQGILDMYNELVDSMLKFTGLTRVQAEYYVMTQMLPSINDKIKEINKKKEESQ